MLEMLPLMIGIMLAQVSPGPNLMTVSSLSLGSGRLAGVSAAAGVATGVFIWSILFAFGAGAFLEAFPGTVTAMKLLGGSYLLYLGIKAVRSSLRKSEPATQAGRSASTRGAACLTGFLVVMTNPKAALMWVAVSMYLAAADLSAGQFLLVGVCASATAMLIYGGYALLFSTGVAMRAYGRFFRAIEASFGIVFGAIGAKLVADGLRALRA